MVPRVLTTMEDISVYVYRVSLDYIVIKVDKFKNTIIQCTYVIYVTTEEK